MIRRIFVGVALTLFAALCGSLTASRAQDGSGGRGVAVIRRFAPIPGRGIRFANVVEIDPARVRLKTVSARSLLNEGRAPLPIIRAAMPEILAGINASFWPAHPRCANPRPNCVPVKPKGTAYFDGFYVEDGVEPPHCECQHTIFYATRSGEVGVAGRRKLPPDIESAVAGLPGTSAGKEDVTARSAVCVTGAGRVRLVAAYPVKTLAAMREYLEEVEGCEKSVILDGGGSTQMIYHGDGEPFEFGWERDSVLHKIKDKDGRRLYTGSGVCLKGEGARQPKACFREVTSALVAVAR